MYHDSWNNCSLPSARGEVTVVYKKLWDILHLAPVRQLAFILLFLRVGLLTVDSVHEKVV